jgi:hypothetical protein
LLVDVFFVGYHVAQGFVKHEFLVRLEVFGVVLNGSHQNVDVGFEFVVVGVGDDEAISAFHGNFQEGFAREVLDALKGFVHEFEEFFDDGFEEFPMRD